MNDIINKKYNDLITNNDDFRRFVENMDKYSNEEIISMYGLKITCSGLLEMPS